MIKKWIAISFIFIFSHAYATEEIDKKSTSQFEEQYKTTSHTLNINGNVISYDAKAGTLLMKTENGKNKASFFYVAYMKNDVKDFSKRPITFCFNGGPGSSSVWLHLGTFGPKRVLFDEKGYANPPYTLVDNDQSILDLTDLVFIDPVSTGYSRACEGEDEKQFHGVDEDVKSIAHFIRLFITKNQRWDSPKYLAGESYGTTRASALASYLHDESYIYSNGILLISSVLNFQTLNDHQNGNDLPYILFLPTYTRASAYYHRLPKELEKDLNKTIKEVEEFALNEYSLALMKGDRLTGEEKKGVISKIAKYTGLSEDFIDRANLRINSLVFAKELLRNEKKTIGRFDTRYTGSDLNACGEVFDYDPSANAIFGAFTAAFNQYIRSDLQWETDLEYKVLASIHPWNYNKAVNQYLNVGEALRDVMTKNEALKVFVASGYYDLATPYFATDYTLNHLNLNPSLRSHITEKYYDGGHMMYVQYPNLVKLKKDIAEFFKN